MNDFSNELILYKRRDELFGTKKCNYA